MIYVRPASYLPLNSVGFFFNQRQDPFMTNQRLLTCMDIIVHSGVYTAIFYYQILKDLKKNQLCNLLRKKYHLVFINRRMEEVFVWQRGRERQRGRD